MKKLFLLSISIFLSVAVFSQEQYQPAQGDISGILQKSNWKINLNIDSPLPIGDKGIPWNENGLKCCVADFNGDGVDDFIVTGLHWVGTDNSSSTVGFLHIYYGQMSGDPILAYSDNNFAVAGNGAIDCTKAANGTFLVALQGGNKGNWAAPYKAFVYKLTPSATTATFTSITELDFGAGRGSILFLDANNDGAMDIFQLGWKDNSAWQNQANIYINDGSDEWWDYEGNCGIRPAANTFVLVYDLNNDGKTDIVYPIQSGNWDNGDPRGILIYYNNGDGAFDEYQVMSFYSNDRLDGYYFRGEDDLNQIQWVDFNNDGWMDLALASTIDNKDDLFGGGWTWPVVLLENKKDGTFAERPFINEAKNNPLLLGGQRGDWATADFDGDGYADLIGGFENQYRPSGGWNSRTYFFKGNGSGGFEETEITLSDANPNGVPAMCRRGNFGRYLVGDFNGDKQPDLLAIGAPFSDAVRINRSLLYYNIVPNYHFTGIKETVLSPVSITSYNNEVCIRGGLNQTVSIYSVTGILVQKEIIQSNNITIHLMVSPGVYLVNVGDCVQKIIVK